MEIGDVSNESLGRADSGLFHALPDAIQTVADQPDAFWIRQRASIRSRIAVEQGSRRPLKALVLASALGLMLLVTAVLKTSVPPPVPQAAQVDPDQELLVAVEQALHSDVPEALVPATILADEMTQPTRPQSKEKENAN